MDKYISHYQLLSKIDSGGMADVYLAEDTKTNAKVAIKVLKEEVSDKEKILERFVQEGLLKFDHENIVRIIDAGTHVSNPYIVMEYIDGVDLEAYIKKYGQLSLNKAIDIFRQLLNALSYMHSKGIIHRDIKPRNILIDKNGVAKLTDFGIAKSLSSHIKTSTGGYLGAPAYSSPEQLDGKSIDFRTDIYSLGITFYESLSGINPFFAKSIEEMIKKKFFDLPVSITSYRNDIPPYIVMILDKCLSRYPKDRFKSAGEILKIFNTQLTPTTFKINENAEETYNTDNITHKKKSRKKLLFLLSGLSVIAFVSVVFIFVYFFSIKPSGANEDIKSNDNAATNVSETTRRIDPASTTVAESSTNDKGGKDSTTDSGSSADSPDTSYDTTTEDSPDTSTETTEVPEKSQESLSASFKPNPLGNLFIFFSHDNLRGEDIFIIMDDKGNIKNTIYFDEYVAKNEADSSYSLGSAISPFLSSDGNYIICRMNGYYTVLLLDINNKTFKTFEYIDENGELSGGSMVRDPSFSADDKFALLSGMDTKITNFGMQVCLFKINEFGKANLEVLTEFGDWINGARFSADGTKIIFNTNLSEIFIIDLTAEHKIMNDNVIQFTKLFNFKGSHPAFSPDGGKIVFEYHEDSDSIAIINIDGTGFKKIYENIYGCQSPSFTSDGKRIIFSAPFGGPPYDYNDIFSIDLNGNNLSNLTNSEDIDDEDPECIY